MKNKTDTPTDNPAILVAICRAAHLTKDRELEKVVKRQLADEYGITLKFNRKAREGIQR